MNIRVKRVYLVQFAFSLPLLRKDIYDLFFKNFKHITHFNFNTSNIFYVLQLFCFVFVLFFVVVVFCCCCCFFLKSNRFSLIIQNAKWIDVSTLPTYRFHVEFHDEPFRIKMLSPNFLRCVLFLLQ